MKKRIKIVALSDTHGKHNKIQVPECDICVFAGDAGINSLIDLIEFNNWFGSVPATYKIFVGGNHDGFLEKIKNYNCSLYFTKCFYLENTGMEIEGIKIWGSPFSKMFNFWHFMKNDCALSKIWDKIPEDADIVITHGPAFGVLDTNNHKAYCGSKSLRQRLEEIKPKFHICGHIHESSGVLKTENTTVVNASILDERYKVKNEPKIIYYEK